MYFLCIGIVQIVEFHSMQPIETLEDDHTSLAKTTSTIEEYNGLPRIVWYESFSYCTEVVVEEKP